MSSSDTSDGDSCEAAPPSSLKNLGRASDLLLGEIGVRTVRDLRVLGAVETWQRLRFAHGDRVTLTWLYALEGALQDCDWRFLTPQRLRALKAVSAKYLRSHQAGRSYPRN